MDTDVEGDGCIYLTALAKPPLALLHAPSVHEGRLLDAVKQVLEFLWHPNLLIQRFN
jgi:hypothetical protein